MTRLAIFAFWEAALWQRRQCVGTTGNARCRRRQRGNSL